MRNNKLQPLRAALCALLALAMTFTFAPAALAEELAAPTDAAEAVAQEQASEPAGEPEAEPAEEAEQTQANEAEPAGEPAAADEAEPVAEPAEEGDTVEESTVEEAADAEATAIEEAANDEAVAIEEMADGAEAQTEATKRNIASSTCKASIAAQAWTGQADQAQAHREVGLGDAQCRQALQGRGLREEQEQRNLGQLGEDPGHRQLHGHARRALPHQEAER